MHEVFDGSRVRAVCRFLRADEAIRIRSRFSLLQLHTIRNIRRRPLKLEIFTKGMRRPYKRYCVLSIPERPPNNVALLENTIWSVLKVRGAVYFVNH